MNTWLVVATSAGVGALVSSILTLLGQWLDRSARREELLLAKSVDLAFRRYEQAIQVANQTRQTVELEDNVVLAAVYYRWLGHLMRHGRLPADAEEERRRSQEEINKRREEMAKQQSEVDAVLGRL